MKSIVWALVITFVLWGAGSAVTSRMGTKDYAGRIFSKNVPYDKYLESYRAVQDQALMRYGDNYKQIAKFLNIEEEAWDRIILLHEADKRKIKISEKELAGSIASFPFFQQNGKFDYNVYSRILRYAFHIEPYQFESELRDTLKIERLVNTVIGAVAVSDDELIGEYRQENEEASVTFTLIDPLKLTDGISAEDGELADYYNKNGREFEKGAEVNIQYAAFSFKDSEKDAGITDEDINNFYETNKDDYKIEGAEDKDIAYQPLESVKDGIRAGLTSERAGELAREKADKFAGATGDKYDMGEAAKEFGIELKKTGYFSRQEKIPDIGWSLPVANAAFELEKDAASGVINAADACYVIKVIDKKPSHIPPFDEAKESVRKKVIETKSWNKSKEEALNLSAKINEASGGDGAKFEDALTTLGLKAEKSGLFKRGQYVPGIGTGEALFKAVFSSSPGTISGAVEAEKGYVIFRVDERKDIDTTKFEEEKEGFKNRLLSRKHGDLFREWFSALKNKAKLENYLEKK
ncbi:MAG: hypothetical protein AUJ75_04520 [Candidatus Omnitrophica bacterium CG1_02_49_10]|nr:MAG: hypothetical protein AUJ75_04520 [Candidatus Omnitrophica bacterium CG1_02_49_10]